MKNYWLNLTLKTAEGEPLFQDRLHLRDHYVIGRVRKKCQEILLCFNTPVTPIILPQALKLSGFHCTLYEDKAGYWLMDGWGQYRSSNGISVNGRRTEFAILRHGDTILLGSPEVSLRYEAEREITDAEKETIS